MYNITFYSTDSTNEQRLASIRRKEALLRKKKQLLKQLIKKLRELIIQSNLDATDQMTSPQRLGHFPMSILVMSCQ